MELTDTAREYALESKYEADVARLNELAGDDTTLKDLHIGDIPNNAIQRLFAYSPTYIRTGRWPLEATKSDDGGHEIDTLRYKTTEDIINRLLEKLRKEFPEQDRPSNRGGR